MNTHTIDVQNNFCPFRETGKCVYNLAFCYNRPCEHAVKDCPLLNQTFICSVPFKTIFGTFISEHERLKLIPGNYADKLYMRFYRLDMYLGVNAYLTVTILKTSIENNLQTLLKFLES